ncbi:hypothetical protein BCR44DRAFT_65922 [Catenaria anguillulae PL171]|uniref:Ricin B lectin domain-containing protein n=1 Tax=Catenaria anguillulae PL171 TaxID=765915 RepID=A0A1Y2HYT2_9FUNG|nr:hypothetical protein BCR44DRAFT_65922 [Catenaria anguillulae PL171]
MDPTILSLKLIVLLAVLAIGQSVTATPVAPPTPVNSTILAPAVAPRGNSSIAVTPPASGRHRHGNSTEAGQPPRRDGCLVNAATRRCLDFEQSRLTVQTSEAQMWTCYDNARAQRVELPENALSPDGPLRRVFIKKWVDGRMYCLDVPGGRTFEGQVVRWWACNWSEAQQWLIDANLPKGQYNYRKNDYHFNPFYDKNLCLDPEAGVSSCFLCIIGNPSMA